MRDDAAGARQIQSAMAAPLWGDSENIERGGVVPSALPKTSQ